MNERAYTVTEVDALRAALKTRWLFGTSWSTSNMQRSRPYLEEEMTKAVEELVRTHMMAGHIALDIYRADGYKEAPV